MKLGYLASNPSFGKVDRMPLLDTDGLDVYNIWMLERKTGLSTLQ